MTFDDFQIENHPQCGWDQVIIREGISARSDLVGRFCNNAPSPITVGTTDSLYIKLLSDASVNYKGFSVSVTGSNQGSSEVKPVPVPAKPVAPNPPPCKLVKYHKSYIAPQTFYILDLRYLKYNILLDYCDNDQSYC